MSLPGTSCKLLSNSVPEVPQRCPSCAPAMPHQALGQARQSWSMLVQAGPSWAKLGQAGPSWAALGQAGPSWSKLGQAGPSWAKLSHVEPSWAKLSQAVSPGLPWSPQVSLGLSLWPQVTPFYKWCDWKKGGLITSKTGGTVIPWLTWFSTTWFPITWKYFQSQRDFYNVISFYKKNHVLQNFCDKKTFA